MGVEISISYQGELRCEAQHGPSKSLLLTDAPTDNMGKGEAFSPTDLVATALGTCILTTMGIVAQRNGWDVSGATAHVTKEMITTPTRRIGRLPVVIRIPSGTAGKLDEEARTKLEHAAHHCPVHKSLHPDIDASIEIHWG